jgi:hypothetical protein
MITDNDLSAIEARYKMATPAPWLIASNPRFYVHMPFSDDDQVKLDRDANAAFVAHARDDIPMLVAEVRLLRATLHGLELISEEDVKIPREELKEVIDRFEKDIEAGISSRNWLPYLERIRAYMNTGEPTIRPNQRHMRSTARQFIARKLLELAYWLYPLGGK